MLDFELSDSNDSRLGISTRATREGAKYLVTYFITISYERSTYVRDHPECRQPSDVVRPMAKLQLELEQSSKNSKILESELALRIHLLKETRNEVAIACFQFDNFHRLNKELQRNLVCEKLSACSTVPLRSSIKCWNIRSKSVKCCGDNWFNLFFFVDSQKSYDSEELEHATQEQALYATQKNNRIEELETFIKKLQDTNQLTQIGISDSVDSSLPISFANRCATLESELITLKSCNFIQLF